MKIGGSIKFEGKGLSRAEVTKDGGLGLSFSDHGSGETELEFSPENFKRLADIVLRFTVQNEKFLSFEGDEGTTSPEDFILLLEDQGVTFSVDGSENLAGQLPVLRISDKADAYSGLFLGLSVPQAEELRRRLDLFLGSIKNHAEACKPKRIGRPAVAKKARPHAAA